MTVGMKKPKRIVKSTTVPSASAEVMPKILRPSTIWITVAAAILLLVANSAFWVNRTIFDTQTFSRIATESVLSDSSTNALSRSIVDRTLADRPIINRFAGDTVTRLVAGLIGSDQVETAIEKVVERLHAYVTSPNPQNVEFHLAGIKSVVTNVIGLVDSERETPKIDSVPDTLVLIDADVIPSFYQLAIVFLWLGPIALVGAVLLLALPYVKRRKFENKLLALQGGAIIIAALSALLVGPLFRPPLMSAIADANNRIVTGNLYDAFIATFNGQIFWLLTFGVIVVTISGGIWVYRRLSARKQRTLV